MGKTTAIKWTDSTFSPWWGCQRVSPGCEHCYAETFSKRVGLKIWGPGDRRQFGDKHWKEPLKWNAAAKLSGKRHLVFCASMADVFEDRRDLDAPRARLWALIRDTPHLTWLLLTKRPEHAAKLWGFAAVLAWDNGGSDLPTWLPNVWLGTTVEDQQRADERIPHLLDVPAAVRFLSCEPILSSVDLSKWLTTYDERTRNAPVGASGDGPVLGGRGGQGVAALQAVERRAPGGSATDSGITADARRGGGDIGVPQGSVRARSGAVAGVRAPSRLDDREPSAHCRPDGDQPHRREQEQQPPIEPRDGDEVAERDSRAPCPRQDGEPQVSRGEAEPRTGPGDSSTVRLEIDGSHGDSGQVRRVGENDQPDRAEEVVPARAGVGIHWVIGGGESGPGARPCDVAWLRSLRDQCAAAGVPYFNKQLGSRAVDPDGTGWKLSKLVRVHPADPPGLLCLNDRKGGDPDEWPEDLRVMEWPR